MTSPTLATLHGVPLTDADLDKLEAALTTHPLDSQRDAKKLRAALRDVVRAYREMRRRA